MKNTSRNDILKIIAMVTMLVDHLGVLIFPELRILRTIGRIAFPIFAYQLALGYKHTSNRKAYRNKLLVFGLIAQVPYMLLNVDLVPNVMVFNVMLLFWFATFALAACEKAKEYFKRNDISLKRVLLGILFAVITIVLIIMPDFVQIRYNEFLNEYGMYSQFLTDYDHFGLSYGSYGILMIVIFYLANQNPIKIIIGFLLVSFLGAMAYGIYVIYYFYDYSYFEAYAHLDTVWNNMVTYNNGLRTLEGYFFQSRSMIAIPIIIGFEYLKPKLRINKKIGYLFYPVHITLLVILKVLLDAFVYR